MNARFHDGLNHFKEHNIYIQQHFKPYEQILTQAGFQVSPDLKEDNKKYKCVFLLLPKNMVETKYMIARSVHLLSEGGMLVCAANNKAGGMRLKSLLQDFGFNNIKQESRNKARVVWSRKSNLNDKVLENSINEGAPQSVLDNKFISQSGIFGWNKTDMGSKILTHHLPNDIGNVGADFGCGYGYLSDFILSKNTAIKNLYCIDSDHRALNCSRQNLEKYNCNIKYMWRDLTIKQNDIKGLDFIVMNPPFHEGKKVDKNIGISFINRSHDSLAQGGRLFMVANKQLAYENILVQKFNHLYKRYEGQGFKVFEAVK